MKGAPSTGPSEPRAPAHCLVQTVAAVMETEPALEAVKINCARQAISVATLGRHNDADLEGHLATEVQRLRADPAGERCCVLGGDNDCATCDYPLPPLTRQNVTVTREGGTVTIARVTCPTAPKFWRWRDLSWPKIVPREVVLDDEAAHLHEWKQQLVAAVLCGVLALTAHLLGVHPLAVPLFLLAYVAGAWFTVHEIWERLQHGTLDVHFLMLTVALGSASIGAWAEGATLLFLFSFSGALEHYAMGRTQREIHSLFRDAPKTATLIDDAGRERSVPVAQLRPGLRLLIKPGEQFPVDAEVVKGATAADESNLTGEAAPVEKGLADTVLAGTLNLWGAIEVVVLRPAHQSALQKIIQLIKEAQHLKAPAQRFTDRFGTTYTYLILSLSLVMFFVWWLGLGRAPFVSTEASKSAFYRAMTLLVVASPCALVLSIPSAVLAAIAWAAKRGILFRGGAAVEKLGEVDVVALDKTGTLTTGELQVEQVESFPPGREQEVARLAYSLERLSTHPLARAITHYGKQHRLPAVELSHFESVTGFGIRAQFDGHAVLLGRREWLAQGLHAGLLHQVPPTDAAHSEVWLAKDGLIGRVLLRDDIRPQAREVVARLRQLGLRTVVLTGDRHATAELLQSAVQVDEVRAELRPEQKVAAIDAFTKQGRKAAMVGDGVNDAPSLAAAYVGVAMGARGSDAALEQAEVVLMHDRLENFLTAFQLSQRARRVIWQNLFISLGTVVVLVGFALAGHIPLTVGVVGHEGSTVVVVLNSLRLLFGRASALSSG
jgi:Cd2+/Zn2+-exporting ATPase